MAEVICIVCPKGCRLTVDDHDGSVRGNGCVRGVDYGRKEVQNPTRVITSTVRATGGLYPRLPVKTDHDIAKALMFDVMRALEDVTVQAPIKRGDIIVPHVCGTDVNIVAARDL